MDFLEFIKGSTEGAEKIIFLCAIGLILEYFRPAEKNQPAKTILFNFIWILNFVFVTSFLMHYLGQVVTPVVETLGGPWLKLGLPDVWWAWLIQIGIFIVMYDFGYYWFHRCQHTWSWFWCHHKLHHTDEHMNATTSFRHHWMENVYRIPFIMIPMALLITVDSAMPVILYDLLLVWAIFTHMNLRLELGPLTPIFAGPQVHRIHHSNQPQHQDRNFAAYFPIWDIMFGTWVRPKKGEFPDCGTLDGETTWSIWEANVGVFKGWYRLWKTSKTPLLETPEADQR
jgi:sterol desaturase/sphingolipid hydroxylase (fatty acid hydroxylase superfamily)